jgi:Tol biopolymer transport system component
LLTSGPAGPEDKQGIWAISTLTGSLRQLRDDAVGASVSRDGSHIAFLNGKRNEIWVMGASGEEARKLVTAEKGYTFAEAQWSPNGKRLAYIKRQRGNEKFAIESRDLTGGQKTPILSDARLRSFCWAPDGSIICARMEPPPDETTINLWEIRAEAGRAAGQLRRITNGAGFSFWYLNTSADGKRLAFVRWHNQSDVYLAELEGAGTRLKPARRLTADDRVDWPSAWTRDSQAVLFYSDRAGGLDIFRQRINDDTAEALVAGPEEERGPQLSPDGSWLLYLAWPKTLDYGSPLSGRLMRIPVSGGPAQEVLAVSGYPGSARVQAEGRARPTARGHPSFRCPVVRTNSCVKSEEVQTQVVFTAFEPLEGRRAELFRVDFDPATVSFWDLSPDGSQIAFLEREERRGVIRIFQVNGKLTGEIPLKGWNHLDSVAWSADGRGLFVTSYSSRGSSLLHVNLNGEIHLLRKSTMWTDTPVPSPDGRYLAFGEVIPDSNAWMIENFR